MLLTQFLTALRRIDAAQRVRRGLAVVNADQKLIASMTLVDAKVAFVVGDHADAAALAERGLRLATETETGLVAWTPLGNLVLAATALRRGDISAAQHHAGKLEEDAVFGREMFPTGQAPWVIMQITEASKGRDKAGPLAREVLGSEATTRWLMLSEPDAVPWLVRLMLRLGERGPAEDGVRFAERLAAQNPDVVSIRAAVVHAAGLLTADLGELRHAADLYTDPWARASVIEDIGALLSDGRRECPEAAEYFEQAKHGYAEVGSLRDLSRVLSRLRGINASPSYRERLRPRSGIPGLTDTEYAVAKLVSRGLTNGQAAEQMFLSRHTVAFHLRKVFQKIGITSRLELAVLWNELDTTAGRHEEPDNARHGTVSMGDASPGGGI
ncbi:helix-turn-helix transcriptional regulator [Amycolatopsis magusensis]|uniref:helix-turn-helix transcriptional regulator n=1 Tax=Amycolatopsis magusensis TaxID=882444 RepID=UPI0037928E00